MSQNIVLTQRYTNDLTQMKNILSLRNLHYSAEEVPVSCVASEANGTLELKEENEWELQTGGTIEENTNSHFLVVTDDDEDSEFGHNVNAESGNWISSDIDYDGHNIGYEDIALPGTVEIGRKQLLLIDDADDEEEDSDYDGNSDDEDINHDCNGKSSIDEKSESSIYTGEDNKYCENGENIDDKEIGSIGLQNLTTNLESEVEEESIEFLTRESNTLDPVEDVYHDKETQSICLHETQSFPQNSFRKQLQYCFDQSQEFCHTIEYQVRVVLIHPLFVLGGKKETTFLNVYSKIFKTNFLSTGFSSVYELCKAMPHVVNGKILDEKGELLLVKSSKNLRAVAGIKSGLRRIVYNILQSHPLGICSHEFEGEFFNEVGKTLTDVLMEHAYVSPKVEGMAHDMLDIVCFSESSQTIVLCKDAEDPALTDGILIGRVTKNIERFNENALGMKVCNTCSASRIAGVSAECSDYEVSKKAGDQSSRGTFGGRKPLHNFGNGQQHEDQATAIGHKSSETSIECAKSVSCSEEYVLQVKLCLRLLLAYWNCAKGIETRNLQEIYERTFATSLDLNRLGFASIEELINCWSDMTLLTNQKPGIVLLQPSVENKRIVKTVCTGLRATVFSALLSSFPDGMDICSFVQSLDQSYSGNFLEILKENGYLNGDITDGHAIFRDDRHYSQLYTSKTLRLLFHDMSDFVRFGCQEDGSVVVKLRCESFPLLDFPDCCEDGFQPETLFEDNIFSELPNASVVVQQSENGSVKERLNNLKCGLHANAFEMDANMHSSVLSVSCIYTKSSLQVLKHQIRLILGSPMYLNAGLDYWQLSSIYEERTGQPFFLAKHNGVKYLVSLMPDVVGMDSISGQAFLKRTSQNKRILSVVNSGIRQVLYWSLLKNPTGIWDQLLEGWYTDFAGSSLVMTLSKHGYKISRKSYLASISTFLEDTCDFVCQNWIDDGLYFLSGNSEDPSFADARLLGVVPSDIQYDPLRELDGFCKGDNDTLDLLKGNLL